MGYWWLLQQPIFHLGHCQGRCQQLPLLGMGGGVERRKHQGDPSLYRQTHSRSKNTGVEQRQESQEGQWHCYLWMDWKACHEQWYLGPGRKI